MQFKTKDLLVTVLPKTELSKEQIELACLLGSAVCIHPTKAPIIQCPPITCGITCGIITCGWCTAQCTITHQQCLPCTRLCTFLTPRGVVEVPPKCDACTFAQTFCSQWQASPNCQESYPIMVRDPEELATLRTQLQDAIKILDKHEKEGTLNPIQTKEQAELVESNISELLNQVREMKKNVK